MRTGDNARNNLTRDTGIGAGTIAAAATVYHEIICQGDLATSIQFYWPDAVSNATITLEQTNFSDKELSSTANDIRWVTMPVTITGPVASAAGTYLTDISWVGCLRIRVKIVATAVTRLYIRSNGKQ